MIVVEQKLLGLFRYRKVFFPTVEGIRQLTSELATNDIVRFQYCQPNAFNGRYFVESFPVSSVCIDLRQGIDAILRAMDRKRCRYEIRAAGKLADRIKMATNSEATTEHYLLLYNSFARAKRRVPRLSRQVLELYRPFSDIFVLYFDGRPMCGHLTVRDDEAKRVLSLFCGNRRLESKVDADLCGKLERYLFWHEIRFYQGRGMDLYDMGGIAHDDPHARFNRFKLSFGGSVVTEYSYTFSGAPVLSRLGFDMYKRLRASGMAALMHRI